MTTLDRQIASSAALRDHPVHPCGSQAHQNGASVAEQGGADRASGRFERWAPPLGVIGVIWDGDVHAVGDLVHFACCGLLAAPCPG
ncbi:hypothetical protein [Cellulomonas dongxiuzhuiae]|uniref:hypothetical protein n=1 Tax=Cellulomonas dongxiuzhuiae TaxID=2819979 RepID=UPI001AAF8566|nr:hypothetical protein [Cellulomonas dongxiuzhuiae]